jgi:hypothetical protein
MLLRLWQQPKIRPGIGLGILIRPHYELSVVILHKQNLLQMLKE